jgi:hypothetical protein
LERQEGDVAAWRIALALAVSGWSGALHGEAQHAPKYDYPTAARADFVIGCLMDHEFKHEFLQSCACRIDAIADQLSYEDYEKASTILGVQRNGGMGRANDLFRDTPVAHAEMAKFHHAQDAAEKSCVTNGPG